MSLLDDENILIEETRKSCDFLSILDDALKKFSNDCLNNSNNGSMFSAQVKIDQTLHEKLPSIDTYNWYYTADNAITLYDQDYKDTVCNICFYEKYYRFSKAITYEYCIELMDTYHKDHVVDTVKDIFKLDDEFLWNRKTFSRRGAIIILYSQNYITNHTLVK